MNVFIPIAHKHNKSSYAKATADMREIVYEVPKIPNNLTIEESRKGLCVTAIVTLILLSFLLYCFLKETR